MLSPGENGYLAPGRPPQDVMRGGYAQNSRGFGLLLKYSKPLERVLIYLAVQHEWYYRKNQRRSKGPGPHTADMVRVVKIVPGGRVRDRMAVHVVAYGPKAALEEWHNKQHVLRNSLVHVSGGRTITKTGKVSGGVSTILKDD